MFPGVQVMLFCHIVWLFVIAFLKLNNSCKGRGHIVTIGCQKGVFNPFPLCLDENCSHKAVITPRVQS